MTSPYISLQKEKQKKTINERKFGEKRAFCFNIKITHFQICILIFFHKN